MRALIVLAAACAVAGLSCKDEPAAEREHGELATGDTALAAPAPAAPIEVKAPASVAAPAPGLVEHTALRTASVREILADSSLVGLTVRVTGICLGYGALAAEGTPPLTRSDWQLADEGFAIWVSGPLPEGCSPTAGGTARSSLLARVAQDTLRGFGNATAKPRRYLRVASE